MPWVLIIRRLKFLTIDSFYFIKFILNNIISIEILHKSLKLSMQYQCIYSSSFSTNNRSNSTCIRLRLTIVIIINNNYYYSVTNRLWLTQQQVRKEGIASAEQFHLTGIMSRSYRWRCDEKRRDPNWWRRRSVATKGIAGSIRRTPTGLLRVVPLITVELTVQFTSRYLSFYYLQHYRFFIVWKLKNTFSKIKIIIWTK